MIIVKVCLNHAKIEEIHLINTGHVNEEGKHLYRFKKPKELNHYEIYHDRKQAWFHLVRRALAVMKMDERYKKKEESP